MALKERHGRALPSRRRDGRAGWRACSAQAARNAIAAIIRGEARLARTLARSTGTDERAPNARVAMADPIACFSSPMPGLRQPSNHSAAAAALG
jgi:hypothetical protein